MVIETKCIHLWVIGSAPVLLIQAHQTYTQLVSTRVFSHCSTYIALYPFPATFVGQLIDPVLFCSLFSFDLILLKVSWFFFHLWLCEYTWNFTNYSLPAWLMLQQGAVLLINNLLNLEQEKLSAAGSIQKRYLDSKNNKFFRWNICTAIECWPYELPHSLDECSINELSRVGTQLPIDRPSTSGNLSFV